LTAAPDITAAPTGPTTSHRRALGLNAALGLALFALAGVVGAWIGSAALLAAAAALLARAGAQATEASDGGLTSEQRRFVQLMLGVTLAAVVFAAVGEWLRRLVFGGAPDAAALGRLALLMLVVSVLGATRLLPHRAGEGGAKGLWRVAGDEVIADLALIAAAALLILIRSRWPDLLAAALIGVRARRGVMTSLVAAWTVIRGQK